MRYFINTSTIPGRPVTVGDSSFTFEPVGLRGGSWSGILAVEESAASILASAGIPTIGEITEERYESEKKKAATSNPSLASLTPPQDNPSLQVRVAERAGSLTPPPTVSEPAERPIESQTLESAEVTPPTEELLKEVTKPKKSHNKVKSPKSA